MKLRSLNADTWTTDRSLRVRGADKPHARTRTPLTLEDAFFLELRDDALSASLRASEVLRELGDG